MNDIEEIIKWAEWMVENKHAVDQPDWNFN